MATPLEVGRVRQSFSRGHFEELACGHTGVDDPRLEILSSGGGPRVGLAPPARSRAQILPESLTDVPSCSRDGQCAPAASSSIRRFLSHWWGHGKDPRWRDLANPHKGSPSTCGAGALQHQGTPAVYAWVALLVIRLLPGARPRPGIRRPTSTDAHPRRSAPATPSFSVAIAPVLVRPATRLGGHLCTVASAR
jgi:hypothetical protein